MKTDILPLPYPLKGLVVNTALALQPPGTTPQAQNVRGYDPSAGKDRGGQRSGLTRYTPSALNGTANVQNLDHTVVNTPLPPPGAGVFIAMDTVNGAFSLFSSGGSLLASFGTGETYGCACWDNSGTVYVATVSGAHQITVRAITTNGTLSWTKTKTGGGVGGPTFLGLCWDQNATLYLDVFGLGTAAHEIYSLSTAATGTINLYFNNALGSLPTGVINDCAFAGGYICVPAAAAFTIRTGNASAGANAVIGDSTEPYLVDACSDGTGFFYVLYGGGSGNGKIAKVRATDAKVMWIALPPAKVTSICYDAVGLRVAGVSSTVLYTFSLGTGSLLSTTGLSGNGWFTVRPSGLGGFDLFAMVTSSNYSQLSSALAYTVTPTTLTATNEGHDAAVYQASGTPANTPNLAGVRLLGVSGGSVFRIPAGQTPVQVGTSVLSASMPVLYSAVLGNQIFWSDGANYVYYDPASDSVKTLTATQGQLPADANGNFGRLLCGWRNRLVIAGMLNDPSLWAMSRVGVYSDFNYNPSPPDEAEAVAGNNATAGVAPDKINSLIPYSDEILLFGGDHTLYQMTGDPASGGRIDLVCDQVGTAWGQPYCRDGQGILYFVSSRGSIYKFIPGSIPERISDPIYELLALTNFSQTAIRLAWDERQFGFHVWLTSLASPGAASTHYFWDTRSEAWWQDSFANGQHNPTAVHVLQGFQATDGVVLVGGWDGCVRYLDVTARDDDGTPIQSYVFVGPLKDRKGNALLVSDLQMTLDTGSGNCLYSVYAGSSAQAALAGSVLASGTFGPGRNRSQALRVRGHALYVKLASAGTVASSWQMEELKAVTKLHDRRVPERIF